jgi:hypothetical protein
MIRIAVLPVPIPQNTRPGAIRLMVAWAAAVTARGSGPGHGHPGADADAFGTVGHERQRRVAVGPQHLAVGHPHVRVPQLLGEHGVVDVADAGRHAHPELHPDDGRASRLRPPVRGAPRPLGTFGAMTDAHDSTSNDDAVLTEQRGRVLLITLNRPDAMNAINGALSAGLWAAVERLDDDPGLTAGVLTGTVGASARAWT